jgi:hypothetical protein
MQVRRTDQGTKAKAKSFTACAVPVGLFLPERVDLYKIYILILARALFHPTKALHMPGDSVLGRDAPSLAAASSPTQPRPGRRPRREEIAYEEVMVAAVSSSSGDKGYY